MLLGAKIPSLKDKHQAQKKEEVEKLRKEKKVEVKPKLKKAKK